MKNLLFLLLILVGLLSVESCKKDQIQTAPDNGIENDSSLDVENRSYQEDACGNISKLCPTCEVGTAVTTKDLQAYVAGQSGSDEAKAYGIDKNMLTIVVGDEEWIIHPAEFFKHESTELLIKHQGGSDVI
ncbi:hypothetical protein LR004_02535 [Candidatus Gracilibacteria bacterium]|nr:hypothetical protein [Candidatus Gracilibacteria bacterium]